MNKKFFKIPGNPLKTSKISSSSSPSCRVISLNHLIPKPRKQVQFSQVESPNVSRQKLKIKNSLLKKSQVLRESRNFSESSKRGSSSSIKISLKKYISSSWLIKKPLLTKNIEQLLIAQMNLNSSVNPRKPGRLQVRVEEILQEMKKSETDGESEESSEFCLPFLKSKLYYP